MSSWRGVNAFIRKHRRADQTLLLKLKRNQRGNYACLSKISKAVGADLLLFQKDMMEVDGKNSGEPFMS